MTKKIFRAILFTALLTMLSCLIFIIGVQYQFYGEARLDSLKSEAALISQSLNNGEDIENFNDFEERITLIDESGTVIYDNKTDISVLDNHSDRKEIKLALKNGEGSATRYSDTFSKSTCYYAIKLDNGSILRVSGDRASVFSVLLQLSSPIAAILLLTIIIALVLASILSKSILKPINEIDPNAPDSAFCYEELSPLISRLRYQKMKLNKKVAELTQSRREFEIVSENMDEGMILTDRSGIILTLNKSIKKLFDIEEDIIGKDLIYLNRSDAFREIHNGILNAEHTETLLDFNKSCYEIITNPVCDENSEACGAVVLVIDVTEKQARDRLRREFTANVSHELKTPLTSILGFSDIIKSGMAKEDDIKEFAADINREAKRLIALVNDIIKLSRLDEGMQETETEIVNLKATANEVKQRLLPLAEKQDISIAVSGEETTINANSSLIFEMLYNLCDNAVKYNRQNGSVLVTVGKNDGVPFISVKDTGIGIPPEHQDRIFERFYRVDKSRSNNSGGTGLGLSIVKHIAFVTGGTVSLKSSLEAGTEITVEWE